jgi:hypothetical protein
MDRCTASGFNLHRVELSKKLFDAALLPHYPVEGFLR